MKLGWFGKHFRTALALTGLACGLGFSQDVLYPDMFALSDVQLLDGVLKERQDLNVETLLSYDVDRLLASRLFTKKRECAPRRASSRTGRVSMATFWGIT